MAAIRVLERVLQRGKEFSRFFPDLPFLKPCDYALSSAASLRPFV